VQKITTPPFNNVLATSGAGKQQLRCGLKHIKDNAPYTTLQQSLDGKKGTSESFDSAQFNYFL